MNTGEKTPQGSSEQEEPQEKIKTTAERVYEAMIAGGKRQYSDEALWDALNEVWKEDRANGKIHPLGQWKKESRFDIFADTKKKITDKFPKKIREYVRRAPSVNDSAPVELTDEEKQERTAYGEKSLQKIEAMFGIGSPTPENLDDQPVPKNSGRPILNESVYNIPAEPLDAKYRDQRSEAYVELEEERRYP